MDSIRVQQPTVWQETRPLIQQRQIVFFFRAIDSIRRNTRDEVIELDEYKSGQTTER